MKDAVAIELAIRQADADDALDQVRAHLAATYGLHRHLQKATTQHLKLRSRAPAVRLRTAVTLAANIYRRACVALVHLGMKEEDTTYRPLKKCHLKAFVVHEQDRRWGDSKKTKPSWIWNSLTFVDEDFSESVKKHIVESKYDYEHLHLLSISL